MRIAALPQRKEHSDLLPTPRRSFLAHPHGAWVSASCGGNALIVVSLEKAGGDRGHKENTGRQNVDTRHLVHLIYGTSDYLLCFKCTFSYQHGQVVNVLYVTFWGKKKPRLSSVFVVGRGLDILSNLDDFTNNSAITIDLDWLKYRVKRH